MENMDLEDYYLNTQIQPEKYLDSRTEIIVGLINKFTYQINDYIFG